MIYGPAQLFVFPSWQLFGEVLLMQTVWIGVLGLVLVLAYQRGMTYLTVNGG